MSGTEVAGLPEGGPADLGRVKAHLAITDTKDDTRLEFIIDAVNSLVRTWRCAEDSAAPLTPVEDRVWKAATVEGCTLLTARLFRRKNSPSGVEAFTDLGPVYVRRQDPDVAMYLGLGDYAPPAVG